MLWKNSRKRLACLCSKTCITYTDSPNRLRSDQVSALASEKWKQLTHLNCVERRLSDAQGHISLVVEERLHEPPRRIYWNVTHKYRNISSHVVLKIVVKSMKNTVGENGLIPTLLVFRVASRFLIISTCIPTNKWRLKLLAATSPEMIAIIAHQKITSLTRKVSPAANTINKWGEEI